MGAGGGLGKGAPMSTTSWAIRRQSDRSRWLLYSLLLVAAACLPLSITDSHWLPGAERLLYMVFWSMLAGIVLGRSRFPGWLMWVVGMAAGITYSVQFALRLLPSPGVFMGDLRDALGWAWQLLFQHQWSAPFPTMQAGVHIATEIRLAIAAVSDWLVAASTGVVSEDITVLWLLVSFTVWVVCWYAGYEMMRTQRALVALLPLGVAIVSNVAVTWVGAGYVHIFAALMLVILVYTNVNRLERIWERLGVDFSAELRRDTLLAGAGISVLVLTLALIMPYATYSRAVDFFWTNYGPALQRFYDRLDRAFAGREPIPEPPKAFEEQMTQGFLPHEVGLSGDLPESLVMLVQVSDPPPPAPDVIDQISIAEGLDPRRLVERRYWRQRTYDVYTGQGWDTSERNIEEVPGLEPWREPPDYPHTVVTQTYTLLRPRSNVVFGVNAPTTVDLDYRVLYRGEDDMVAFSVEQPQYTVVSYAPQPEITDLLTAEGEYPAEIAERYLALPRVPQRVIDLAQEIVSAAGAETRYDKARAIELYLRRFVYDLDVPPPPPDQDITDYFLFEAQRGFCDYSASAMVVMLRAVGVAARYASGYGMGHYDYARDAWAVTTLNAHAWAEVYFPGLGWIEFEPTPIELPREFAGAPAPLPPQPLPQMPLRDEPVESRLPPSLWVGVAVLGAALVALRIWSLGLLRSRLRDPGEVVRRTYDACWTARAGSAWSHGGARRRRSTCAT